MSASLARSAAARANGRKSHGPQTPEGKLASSRNATRHGLTGRTVVLDTESEAQYQAELAAYLDHFRPVGKPETDLVHQLAATNWRLARYTALEAALLDEKMAHQATWMENYEQIPQHRRLAIAFGSLTAATDSLGLLNRYQARLQREYLRLLKTLMDLQAARARQADAQAAPPAEETHLPNEPKPSTHTGSPVPETPPTYIMRPSSDCESEPHFASNPAGKTAALGAISPEVPQSAGRP